jgi:hypothetical protein
MVAAAEQTVMLEMQPTLQQIQLQQLVVVEEDSTTLITLALLVMVVMVAQATLFQEMLVV